LFTREPFNFEVYLALLQLPKLNVQGEDCMKFLLLFALSKAFVSVFWHARSGLPSGVKG
jgi:hypothetical protein